MCLFIRSIAFFSLSFYFSPLSRFSFRFCSISSHWLCIVNIKSSPLKTDPSDSRTEAASKKKKKVIQQTMCTVLRTYLKNKMYTAGLVSLSFSVFICKLRLISWFYDNEFALHTYTHTQRNAIEMCTQFGSMRMLYSYMIWPRESCLFIWLANERENRREKERTNQDRQHKKRDREIRMYALKNLV